MTYSLNDIDRMRRAITDFRSPYGANQYPGDMDAAIEDQLRTYMLAGISPWELEEKARAKWEAKRRAAEDARKKKSA